MIWGAFQLLCLLICWNLCNMSKCFLARFVSRCCLMLIYSLKAHPDIITLHVSACTLCYFCIHCNAFPLMTADLRCPAGTFFQRSNIIVWNKREQMDSDLFLEGDVRESDGCLEVYVAIVVTFQTILESELIICLLCHCLIIQELCF